MQEIFYNGNIFTNNEKKETAQAMLINDGAVVFVGQNEEILQMKTDDTKVNDLKNRFVYPNLFCLKANVFQMIDDKIKSANKKPIIQIIEEDDENYEKFDNFDKYKDEYKKIEKQLIKKGVSTIVELGIEKKEFCFWKMMSDKNLLEIDVVGYIDLVLAKKVMDNNCVTYRKYKNRFRVGGYYLKIDGKVHELKAWFNKSYSGTKSHFGISEQSGEQLYFLVKTALDERKQIVFETNGDKAIEEVLLTLEEVEKKDKIENFYRPVLFGVNVVHKKLYDRIKHFDITLCFEIFDEQIQKSTKKFIGFFRRKHFHNYKKLIKSGVKLTMVDAHNKLQDLSMLASELVYKKRKTDIHNSKNHVFISDFTNIFANIFYCNPALSCFDQDTKATIETQKQANFFVLDKPILNSIFDNDFEKHVKSVYISGEKKY